MSDTYSRLAAVRPANTSEQDLYALTTGSLVGVVHVCNQDTADRQFSVAVTDAAAGVAASGEDWIEYDTIIPGNITFKVTIEGLSATSTIRIKSDAANLVSFVLMGIHT